MVAIFGLFIGIFGSVILGTIVLSLVPSFKLTTGNLLTFILGSFLGMFAVANLVERVLYAVGLLRPMPIASQNELGYVLALFGALIGGTTLVWLKLRWLTGRRQGP